MSWRSPSGRLIIRMLSLKEFCLCKLWNVCDINARQQVMDYLAMFYEVRRKLKLQLWMRWSGWDWILSSSQGSPVAGQRCSFHLCAIAENQKHRPQSWQASWCMFTLQSLERFQYKRVHYLGLLSLWLPWWGRSSCLKCDVILLCLF